MHVCIYIYIYVYNVCTVYILSLNICDIPVVPQKAVAEVSKIVNL